MPEFLASYGICTQAGHTINQDSWFCETTGNAFGVLDGIGGDSSGGEASKIAKKPFEKMYSNASWNANSNVTKTKQSLNASIAYSHEVVCSTIPGSGTTVVIGVLVVEHNKLYLVYSWVGDSRAYLHRNNELEILTIDNSDSDTENKSDLFTTQAHTSNLTSRLTVEDEIYFRYRNQLEFAIGHDIGNPIVKDELLEPGDKILLCSDGVSDNLTTIEINAILSGHESAQRQADLLVNCAAAVARVGDSPRAKPDDTTALVVHIH